MPAGAMRIGSSDFPEQTSERFERYICKKLGHKSVPNIPYFKGLNLKSIEA